MSPSPEGSCKLVFLQVFCKGAGALVAKEVEEPQKSAIARVHCLGQYRGRMYSRQGGKTRRFASAPCGAESWSD